MSGQSETYLSKFLVDDDEGPDGGGTDQRVESVGHSSSFMSRFLEEEPANAGDTGDDDDDDASEPSDVSAEDEDSLSDEAVPAAPAAAPIVMPTTSDFGVAVDTPEVVSKSRPIAADEDDSHEDDFELDEAALDDLSSDTEDEGAGTTGPGASPGGTAMDFEGTSGSGRAFDKMGAEQKERFNTQGTTILAALASGRGTQESWKIPAPEDDESSEEVFGTAPKHMVNPMLYGGAEDVVDYGSIFGADLEWFPETLRVWQLNKFMPDKVPFHHYGRFYSKETYLVLSIVKQEGRREERQVNVHMWVGNETSMDKSGGAAFRISELSGWLAAMSAANEIPARVKQYREEQGEESDVLRSYFRKYGGMTVHEGGTDSSFRHVVEERVKPTLYRVRSTGHTYEVRLDAWSLNRRQVFLLDAGEFVYVYKGAKATYFDRFKAVDLATRIVNKERHGRSAMVTVEDDDDEREHPTTDFWRLFGLLRPPRRFPDEADDGELEPTYRMYQTQNLDGKFDLVEITERPLTRSMLSREHCIIFDCFYTIYAWKGRSASPLEKAASDLLAEKFLKEMANRPKWARVITVLQTAEPIFFREKFSDWQSLEPAVPDDVSHVADARPPPEIDIRALMEPAPYEATVLGDGEPGSGDVWCVVGKGPKFDKLDEAEKGIFYEGCCYMLLVAYTAPACEKDGDYGQPQQAFRVYFWRGRGAPAKWYPAFLFGFYPVLAQKISGQAGRHVDQCLVHQGSEPEPFAALFANGIVVRSGERPPDGVRAPDAVALYDVRVQYPSEIVRAIQVPLSSAYLHSAGTFMLERDGAVASLWFGAATAVTIGNAAGLAIRDRLQSGDEEEEEVEPEYHMEGEEEASWWEAVGGKGPYYKLEQRPKFLSRLYECDFVEGVLDVREVVNYCQASLQRDNCYLLDMEDRVFVWYGTAASDTLRHTTLQVGNVFVRTAAVVRTRFVDLEAFAAGNEPLAFRAQFHTWSPGKRRAQDVVDAEHASRYRRFCHLHYYAMRAVERRKQHEAHAARIARRNEFVVKENEARRERNEAVAKHNAKMARQKREEAETAKRNADREARRAAKAAAHAKEMQEMEEEMERRRRERAERRARLGL